MLNTTNTRDKKIEKQKNHLNRGFFRDKKKLEKTNLRGIFYFYTLSFQKIFVKP